MKKAAAKRAPAAKKAPAARKIGAIAEEIPEDLRQALARSADAKAAFDGMPPSHKREYISWIEEAKRPGTRARRVEQTIGRLIAERMV